MVSILKTVSQACLVLSLAACASQITYDDYGADTNELNFPLLERPRNQVSPVQRLTIDQGIPKTAPIAVVSFANIDNLTEVSSLGRYLSEFFTNELVQYGYPVYDLEAQDEVMLMKRIGSIYRTRQGNLSEGALSEVIPRTDLVAMGVRYLLTGTYTTLEDRVIVQTRLIDVVDAKIASTVAMSLARRGMIAELAARSGATYTTRMEVMGP
jgi:TolB-like protein